MSHHLGTMTCEQGSVLTSTFLDLDVDDNDAGNATDLAVLIRVPAIRPMRPARRPSAHATARIRANRMTVGHRPRRRLRKSVRTAASLLLTFATLASAAILLRSGIAPGAVPSVEARESSPPRLASASAPAVWLRIETAREGALSRPEPAVVLPGYVLPDDGMEDSHHAGR